MAPDSQTKQEWYHDGLHFGCTQCGNCCSGPSGYVWFSKDEALAMAAFLKITPAEFFEQYTYEIDGHYSLAERRIGKEFDCIFLRRDDDGSKRCSIYEVRPTQCRTWPFWPENLKHPRNWQRASRRCPGIERGIEGEGEFFPIEKIRIQRDATPS